jgi:hypothetical protein
MDYNSFLTTLSSSLSVLQTPEFSNLKENLHSFTHTITSLEHEVTAAISAIPAHPYERLKYQYFGPDYEFKTIDDVEEPVSIDSMECVEFLKKENEDLTCTLVECATSQNFFDTAFTFLSGDVKVPNYKRQKDCIEFLEIAKSIPIDKINDENCFSIARKLIGLYLKNAKG